MSAPNVNVQRDNLSIGLYLARNPIGAELDDCLINALGWRPDEEPNRKAEYHRRFTNAQQLGRDSVQSRRAGYFTWNAQPFGPTFLYRVLWYVLRNPENGMDQTIPIFTTDLQGMRRYRDKYLATLTGTTRRIRAGDDLQALREADARGDSRQVQHIQQRMLEDGALGEILSGYFGLEYADIGKILPSLQNHPLGRDVFDFQKSIRKIGKLEADLEKEKAKVSDHLSEWVKMQTGLPGNARQLALDDASHRLTEMR